jgi:hypothetical protein
VDVGYPQGEYVLYKSFTILFPWHALVNSFA